MIKIEKDEKIILEVRRHWFTLLAQWLPFLLVVGLPLLLKTGYNLLNLSEFVSFAKHPQQIFTLLSTVWILFVWVTIFVIWTDYYLDILIVTNRRILDIEQLGLFSREISSFRLDRIQDITVRISGVIPTFLDFGDIHIQTAGEVPEIVVKGIPNPHHVRELITREQDVEIDKGRQNINTGV